jgi:hypothetical protein
MLDLRTLEIGRDGLPRETDSDRRSARPRALQGVLRPHARVPGRLHRQVRTGLLGRRGRRVLLGGHSRSYRATWRCSLGPASWKHASKAAPCTTASGTPSFAVRCGRSPMRSSSAARTRTRGKERAMARAAEATPRALPLHRQLLPQPDGRGLGPRLHPEPHRSRSRRHHPHGMNRSPSAPWPRSASTSPRTTPRACKEISDLALRPRRHRLRLAHESCPTVPRRPRRPRRLRRPARASHAARRPTKTPCPTTGASATRSARSSLPATLPLLTPSP